MTADPGTPLRCSVTSRLRADSMAGTAAPATGFLLVEQPGGWGRQALTSSRLDPKVGRRVSARAIAQGLRVLLVRRPGRHQAPARRRWAVVVSRPGREATWWGDFGHDEELLSLPLDGSAGSRSDEPFFLVCTHGRHDTCCAVEGRPVAAALHQARPGRVWECSHVGGDRFAANVLAMPHGVYYGRVEPDEVEALATAHESGEVYLERVRGRTTSNPAAQAAIVHVSRVLGETRLDALTPAGTIHLGDGRWQVRLRGRPGTLMVTVQSAAGARPGLLTCHAQREAHPPRFEIVEIRQLP
ncbi:MAG TPA: sucrase ferredoxin [Actinomycetes bacterium]|nr:sucrase ferredoxin [Actinomycetes bacterium]